MEGNKLSSKGAHFAVGVLVAAASVYLARDIFTPWQLLLLACGCVWGSSSPDWMEISGWAWWGTRYSLIPHRTITHWMMAWIAATIWTMGHALTDGTFIWCIAAGFTLSGLTHVLMDARTPMGVPVFHPYKRRKQVRRHRR
ncbi:MAG: metal-dependent hydrolase [Pseudomonas sp.]|jgi:inner membrane protein|nr:metal-dependent hydrolase [uncultured Noviherbaspirillum sp.]RZI60406.1 MAG: metal-dependent hydrolase [Pseudomonas sp.]